MRSRCGCTPRIPARGWQPQAGTLHRSCARPRRLRSTRSAGPGSGSTPASSTARSVGVHYDPMLAKVISWRPTRTQAAARCSPTRSPVPDPRCAHQPRPLVNVLRHPAFIAGDTDTAFFDTHDLAALAAPLADADAVRWSALAAALADAAHNRDTATVFAALPAGWRNVPSRLQRRRTRRGRGRTSGRYRFGRDGLSLPGDDERGAVSAAPDRVVLRVDGVDRAFDVAPIRRRRLRRLPPRPGAVDGVPRFPDPGTRVAARLAGGADARRGEPTRRGGGRHRPAGQPIVVDGGDEDGARRRPRPRTASSPSWTSRAANKSSSAPCWRRVEEES